MKQDKSVVFQKLTSAVMLATACMCSINQSSTDVLDRDASGNSAVTPHAAAVGTGIDTGAGIGVGTGARARGR